MFTPGATATNTIYRGLHFHYFIYTMYTNKLKPNSKILFCLLVTWRRNDKKQYSIFFFFLTGPPFALVSTVCKVMLKMFSMFLTDCAEVDREKVLEINF